MVFSTGDGNSLSTEPAKKKMPSRKGIKPEYKTEVAAKLNWLRRILKGSIGAAKAHNNFLWIRAHPNYDKEITPERKIQLRTIEEKLRVMREATQEVIDEIEQYYLLPTTPAPRKTRQKALQGQLSAIQAHEKQSRG